MRTLAFVTLVLGLLVPAIVPAAAQQRLGDIVITEARSRATPPSANVAGGYLTIENTGTSDDRLVGIETDLSERAELHEMKMEDGVMKMRALGDGIAIPAGGTVELKPGGLHLMFMGIRHPLKEGDEVPVKLTFETAGSIEVMLKVGSIGGYGQSDDKTDGASGHGGHGGHGKKP